MLCQRLALLAEEQLQGTDFTMEEKELIQQLGLQLARLAFYKGESYTNPRDDAPRIARISSDPKIGGAFHVGVGRPRLLYVLYPWKGQEILCQGAVLTYHEVSQPGTMTDDEWRAQFERETRPPVPAWLEELVPEVGRLK